MHPAICARTYDSRHWDASRSSSAFARSSCATVQAATDAAPTSRFTRALIARCGSPVRRGGPPPPPPPPAAGRARAARPVRARVAGAVRLAGAGGAPRHQRAALVAQALAALVAGLGLRLGGGERGERGRRGGPRPPGQQREP